MPSFGYECLPLLHVYFDFCHAFATLHLRFFKHMQTHVHTYTHTHAARYCIQKDSHVHAFRRIHACTYMQTHIPMHACMLPTHARAHTHIYAHTRTRSHTNSFYIPSWQRNCLLHPGNLGRNTPTHACAHIRTCSHTHALTYG
jgi:hypothetical protein